ncbi:MAG: RNA polymerase sigma factor [Bacteroidales bacterium]|nr:RNA polymerase sigma factor [Bacteroidales bacterium]
MFNEKELIRKVRNGDSRSFNLLYELYVSDLYNFVFSYVKSGIVADEIVQEAFVRLWLNRARLDENRSVKSYLFTISWHNFLKELKWVASHPLIGEFIEFSCALNDEAMQKYDFNMYLKAISAAKSSLTPRQKEIFSMVKEDGMKVAEVAELLGIKEQVVRNQLSLAVRRIREYVLERL